MYDFSLLLFRHGFIGNDDGVGSEGDEAIDVATEINLDNITGLESGRFGGEGRVVANDIVDGNAGGEGNTLFNTLVLEDTFALLFNEEITESASISNKLSSYTLQLKRQREGLLE